MSVRDQSLDWGAICDRCPDLPGCVRGDGPFACPVDGSLVLYEESVSCKNGREA